jgi:Protein of unknown function (DUF1254)
MDITRLTSTNIEAGKEPLKRPMDTFSSGAAYPPGDLKLVVRINFDTLYSLGWLDLTKEPVVVSSPDTNGCYFSCRCSISGPMCSHCGRKAGLVAAQDPLPRSADKRGEAPVLRFPEQKPRNMAGRFTYCLLTLCICCALHRFALHRFGGWRAAI